MNDEMRFRCDARCWIGDGGRVWCMLDAGHEGSHAVWEGERYRYEWADGVLKLTI